MRYRSYSGKFRHVSYVLFLGLAVGCSTSNKVLPPVEQSPSTPIATSGAEKSPLVCQNADVYQNQSVGDGHCVALVQHCAQAPHTSRWRPGDLVLNSQLSAGTVIATFEGQRYTNRRGQHAAVYISHDSKGIWVWDQWLGTPVQKRLIRIRHDGADASNTAQAFRVVQLTDEY